MTQTPGLTKEEHQELGMALAVANDTISAAIVKVSAAYPANGPEAKALEELGKAFTKARSRMDEAICRELPQDDDDAARAYYPIRWPDVEVGGINDEGDGS